MEKKRIGHRGKKLQVWQNQSHSSPDKVYETIYWENGELTCNCRGWILHIPRTCRHVKSAEFSMRKPPGVTIPHSGLWERIECMERTEIITPKKYYRMIRVAE